MSKVLRAATAHISSHVLSARNTTQKVITSIHQAAKQDAHLIAFPESFIPAFPVWSTFLPPVKAHHLFHRMVEESIYADGEEIKAIRDAAARSKLMVNIGFTEKTRYSSATLFNSNLILGSDGKVLVHHRKLVPTWIEKLTWAAGDGHGLRVADTDQGKIGALICGENTNPLARFSLMAQGEQVHISTWPAVWPSRTDALENSADQRQSTGTASLSSTTTPMTSKRTTDNDASSSTTPRNYDNLAANRTRAAAHCFEAKCYGIMCAPYLSPANIHTIASLTPNAQQTANILQNSPKAASMFLDPTGQIVPSWTIDASQANPTHHRIPTEYLQDTEGILYADLNLDACVEGKQYHDVVGGYQRLDVFDLKVNRQRQPVVFED